MREQRKRKALGRSGNVQANEICYIGSLVQKGEERKRRKGRKETEKIGDQGDYWDSTGN